MPTINPWLILGAVLTAIGLVFGGYVWGDHARDVAWKAKTETDKRKAVEQALATERTNQEKANAAIRQQSADQAAINTRLRADLASLRRRPERSAGVSPAARPACTGATGAELSRSDAEFLVGEAARADEVRAGLISCYAVIDSSRK